MPDRMETTIKAANGDRAANLEGIADQITRMIPAPPADPNAPVCITGKAAHTLRGYAEQLRIIASDWRNLIAQISE